MWWTRKNTSPIHGVIDDGKGDAPPRITWDNLLDVLHEPGVVAALRVDPAIIADAYVTVHKDDLIPILQSVRAAIRAGKHRGLNFITSGSGRLLITAKPEPAPDHLYQWDDNGTPNPTN